MKRWIFVLAAAVALLLAVVWVGSGSPASANHPTTVTFQAGTCVSATSPTSCTEQGMVFTSLYPLGPHLHLTINQLFAHSSCCSHPYQITHTSGQLFTLVQVDISGLNGSHTFIPPSGPSVPITSNGTFVFPPTFACITSAQLESFSGSVRIDNLVVGPCESIEKELLEGPAEIGIYLPEATQYVFEIAYSGPAAKVIDTVPAEFECVNLVPTAGTATCSNTSKGKGNSANRIEWDVPAGSNTLTVTVQTVASPGKGHKEGVVFKPTSCGPLPINDGATAFDVDENGDLVFDAEGNPIVIVGPSNALQATAVAGTKPCDEIIDADGTATAGDGLGSCRSPVTPGAVQVTNGDLLASFPDGGAHASGLDWFDQDSNGVWTLTCNGDDLHLEATEFCPTGIRDGTHDLGLDCKVLDFNGDLANGQQVDCDLEVAFNWGTTVAVCPDPLIKYFDADADGAYDDGEDIVLDANNNGVFD